MYSSTEANDVDVSGYEKPKYAGCGKTKEYLKKNYDIGAAKKMGICLDWLHNICYWGHQCKWDHVLPPKKVADEEKRWRERKASGGEKKAKLSKKEKLSKRLKGKRKPKVVTTFKFTENAWGRTRPSFSKMATAPTSIMSNEATPKPPSVDMTDRTSVYEEMSHDSLTSNNEVAPPAYPVPEETGAYGPPPALADHEWLGAETPEANYVLVEDPAPAVTMGSTFPVEGPLAQALAPTPAPKPAEAQEPAPKTIEAPTPAPKPVEAPKSVEAPNTVTLEAPTKRFGGISLNAEAPVYTPSVAGSIHSEVEPYRSYMSVGSLTPAPSVHNDVTYYQPPVVPATNYVPTYTPQYMQPNVAARYLEQMNAMVAAQNKMQHDYQADMARRQIEHERLLRQHEQARQLAVREQQMRMNYEAQLAMLREQALRQARENQALSRQLQLRNSISHNQDYSSSTPLLVQSQMAPVHIPDEEVVWPARNHQEEVHKPTRPPMSARALAAESIYTENPPAAVGHAQGGDRSNPSLFTTENTLEGLVSTQQGKPNMEPAEVGPESPQETERAPPAPLSERKPKAEPVAESKPEEVGRRLRKKRVKRRQAKVEETVLETPKPPLELESSVTESIKKPVSSPRPVEAHAPVVVEAQLTPAKAEAVLEAPAEEPQELLKTVEAEPEVVGVECVVEPVEETLPAPQVAAPGPRIVEAPKPAPNSVSNWIKLAKAEAKPVAAPALVKQKPAPVKTVTPKRKKCIWEVFDFKAARKMNLCLKHVEGLCKAIGCQCDKRGCPCEHGATEHKCKHVRGYNCVHEHKMPTVKIQKIPAEELKYRQRQTGEKKTRMTKRERFYRINRRSLAKAKETQRQNGAKEVQRTSRPKVVFVRSTNSIAWTAARTQAALAL